MWLLYLPFPWGFNGLVLLLNSLDFVLDRIGQEWKWHWSFWLRLCWTDLQRGLVFSWVKRWRARVTFEIDFGKSLQILINWLEASIESFKLDIAIWKVSSLVRIWFSLLRRLSWFLLLLTLLEVVQPSDSFIETPNVYFPLLGVVQNCIRGTKVSYSCAFGQILLSGPFDDSFSTRFLSKRFFRLTTTVIKGAERYTYRFASVLITDARLGWYSIGQRTCR